MDLFLEVLLHHSKAMEMVMVILVKRLVSRAMAHEAAIMAIREGSHGEARTDMGTLMDTMVVAEAMVEDDGTSDRSH
jgi:hypothetical protein